MECSRKEDAMLALRGKWRIDDDQVIGYRLLKIGYLMIDTE
jgi:hypothetical protein